MVKYGFKILNGQIFDTRISSYAKKGVYSKSNVVYIMQCSKYKRLYFYEALLNFYSENEVFEVLKINRFLKRERESHDKISIKSHYFSNSMMVYNYPVSFLSPRMFQLYKTCQKLKEKLE